MLAYRRADTFQAAEQFAKELGIQGARYGNLIDREGITPSQEAESLEVANEINKTLYDHANAGYPLPRYVFASPDDENTVASYDRDGENININNECAYWHSPSAMRQIASDQYKAGFNSSDSPDHMMRHELGHVAHMKVTGGLKASREHWDADAKGIAAKDISRYAAKNPDEFVAEVFAGHRAGKSYGAEVMALYSKFEGPTLK